MNSYGSGQLGYAGYRRLYLFAGCHNQVGKLIDYNDDVGQIAVAFFGIQLPLDEFLVVFLDVAHLCIFQQVVTGVHFDAERVERVHYLGGVCDDGLFFVRQLRQEVLFNDGVDA